MSSATESFLRSQMKDNNKKKGRSKAKIVRDAIELHTANFFANRVLSDDIELAFWHTFMTGIGPDGQPVKLDAVSWQAFRQAVAYKRGMPTVRVDSKKQEDISITFNVIGGSAPSTMKRVMSEEQKAKISESMTRTLAAKREDPNILDAEVVDSEELNSEV
jgi:hypothetical protein